MTSLASMVTLRTWQFPLGGDVMTSSVTLSPSRSDKVCVVVAVEGCPPSRVKPVVTRIWWRPDFSPRYSPFNFHTLFGADGPGGISVDAMPSEQSVDPLVMVAAIGSFRRFRDPDTFDKFDEIVLTHTCRDHAELAYGVELTDNLAADPLIGELTEGRVTRYSTTTREITPRMGRITRLIENGRFHEDLGIAPLSPETDRVMICGSIHMIKDVKELVEGLGFKEGSLSHPADFVVERAFVG